MNLTKQTIVTWNVTLDDWRSTYHIAGTEAAVTIENFKNEKFDLGLTDNIQHGSMSGYDGIRYWADEATANEWLDLLEQYFGVNGTEYKNIIINKIIVDLPVQGE
jgi:hypothetical protein